MIDVISSKALTEITIYKKKQMQRDIAVNTRHEIKTPTDAVAANINYFFESKIMEIEPNPRRMYFSEDNIFSEDDIIQKFVTLNESTVAVTDYDMMVNFNITDLLMVETSIIKSFIGTYKMPNVTFTSALFKPNTSYIAIINNSYLKVLNSYTDLYISGITSISLYESGYKLYEMSPTSQRLRVKNTPVSVLDKTFILYDFGEDINGFKYFPYFFKEMIDQKVIIVQNKNDVDSNSDLDFYFQVMGYDTYTEAENDPNIGTDNPDSYRISDDMPPEADPEADFMAMQTFNPNEKMDIPNIQPVYSREFKLVKVTELNGNFAFYYVHRFTPNSLFFYNGLLVSDYRVTNTFPGTLLGTEFITTELDANVAIFPLSYQLDKLVCLMANSLSPIGYEYEDYEGVMQYTINDNNPSYPGSIQIYSNHKEYAYRRHLPQDLLNLNVNPEDAVVFELYDAYLTEKGLKPIEFDTSGSTPVPIGGVSFYCKPFMSKEYLFINLPDTHAVIKSEITVTTDITEYSQIEALLDRGIFLLPEYYSMLFINGRMIDPKNIIRLFGNYCTVDPVFYSKKISNVTIQMAMPLSSKGSVIAMFNQMSLEKLVDPVLTQYFVNLYSVKEEDTDYLEMIEEPLAPYESYKGKYDRLAHFLSSKIVKTFLDSPVNMVEQEKFKAMVKTAFHDLSVEELGLGSVNGDNILIFPGNNTSRYDPHK